MDMLPPTAFDFTPHDPQPFCLTDTGLPPTNLRDITLTVSGLPTARTTRAVATASMADTGANVCLTNDPSILVDITDITPIPLGVALSQPDSATSLCSQQGYLPLPFLDGTFHYQPFLINPQATDTILSPTHVMKSSNKIFGWSQSGSKHSSSNDSLTFTDESGSALLILPLTSYNGLQYCSHTPCDSTPTTSIVRATITYDSAADDLPQPTSTIGLRRVLESELWAARLGFCSHWQLTQIPKHATGTPPKFFPHPLRFIDHKEQARIRKRAAGTTSNPARHPGQRFGMDFGFIRASRDDYSNSPSTSRVVESYDGYVAYLIIVDENSKYVWIFLRKSKEPPTDLVSHFLQMYGRKSGGVIRCDQGGELARSHLFRTTMMEKHLYVVEPTGADSPSQNGGSEKWNDTLAVTTRALLYGASLPAQYWSAALTHAAYLHNRRVHSATNTTPYEKWYGHRPNLHSLRIFGSRVCVKRTGDRRAKLDKHDFTGIFIGYTATDSNIRYIDTSSGLVKTSHHAVFDECWFHQSWRPPAAQVLYDLGTKLCGSHPLHHPATPTLEVCDVPPSIDPQSDDLIPSSVDNTLSTDSHQPSIPLATINMVSPNLPNTNTDASMVDHYGISHRDVEQVYFSPDCFSCAFEETFTYLNSATALHPTAGLIFSEHNGRLYITDIAPSTPCAKIPRWRTRLKNTWITQINGTDVSTIHAAKEILNNLPPLPRGTCKLLVHSTDLRDGLTNEGIPQLTLDQLNPRHFFATDNTPTLSNRISKSWDGGVLQYLTRASKLTRGVLLKQTDWDEWQQSEFLQLDQYELQNMFGSPVIQSDSSTVFNLVWTYAVKEVDGRKKARCTCDGSTRGGQVRVLDYTYANSPDHTCSRIFYAISSAENLLIFGADVSNAFAEAPPPKQGFYIRPDPAFRAWWTIHKGRPPLPSNAVIPILSAMQGHPEAPRLWEKHADKILRSINLQPTTHEPCLYSGVINNSRILFLRQVDDFAIAATSESVATHVLDLIEDQLTIPLKRLGLVSLFNGLDIEQTQSYIKISCTTYINRICDKYLETWLRSHNIPNRATPLPQNESFIKTFLSAEGDPDPRVQEELSTRMGLKYRNGVGELIYALVTCRPDISYAVVKCAQNTVTPHEVHYHGLRHLLKYLYVTRQDGLYYWRQTSNTSLPLVPNPTIHSSPSDILQTGRPTHNALDLHGYVDSDWATCPRTRRSLTGVCLRLAGGTIAYKTKLQPTIAQSSTEAEFMGASDFGKLLLYVRSILWDLGIPQHAASILYEDNDACTAMAMAQKPTSRTRHMDIKYHVICEWVEQDLLKLNRIDTTINLADLFTKSLGPTLFYRHTDYVLGHTPPHYSPQFCPTPVVTHTLTTTPSPNTPTIENMLVNTATVWSAIARNPFWFPP